MNTNDTEIISLMHRYFEGVAEPKEIDRLFEWVKQSPRCERIFLRERRIYDAIMLNDQVHASLQQEAPYRSLASRRLPISTRRWLTHIAALLIVALCSGVFVWVMTHREHEAQWTTIRVPAGQYVSLVLSDSTRVWLNGGATFAYPSAFGCSTRDVRLDGEGYFEVTHDSQHPFRIAHYAGMIEVLGTTFDLIASERQGRYETTLVEGRVRMTTLDRHELVLTSGQRAVYANAQLTRLPYESYDDFSWRRGLFAFNKQSFAEIIDQLEQVYGIEIDLPHPEKYTIHYTGKFRRDDGLEHALRVLQHDIPFTFRIDSEHQKVYIK